MNAPNRHITSHHVFLKEFDWESLTRRDGDELEAHYRHLLEELGKQPGMLGIIFRKASNKIQDPAERGQNYAKMI